MTIKFTVKATREHFMEPDERFTHEWYVVADSYEEASEYVLDRMSNGGWKIESFNSEKIYVFDVRGGEEKIL